MATRKVSKVVIMLVGTRVLILANAKAYMMVELTDLLTVGKLVAKMVVLKVELKVRAVAE